MTTAHKYLKGARTPGGKLVFYLLNCSHIQSTDLIQEETSLLCAFIEKWKEPFRCNLLTNFSAYILSFRKRPGQYEVKYMFLILYLSQKLLRKEASAGGSRSRDNRQRNRNLKGKAETSLGDAVVSGIKLMPEEIIQGREWRSPGRESWESPIFRGQEEGRNQHVQQKNKIRDTGGEPGCTMF